MDRNEQRRTRSAGWVAAGVAVLLLSFVAQAVGSMRVKSVTTDEIMYVASGYYHLETGSFEMNMTNPPLMKLISAAPLLTLDLDLPPVVGDPLNWTLSDQWRYAREFLYANRVDADRILFRARIPVVIIGALLGLYVFFWARQLYGDVAGLFSLFLYAFSPNLIAHTRLATLDLGLAAFMFMFAFHWWRLWRRPGPLQLGLCGLFFSAAVLTKTTAFFLLPIAGLYALGLVLLRPESLGRLPRIPGIPTEPWRGRLQQIAALAVVFAVIGVMSVVLVNVCYGFQGTLVDSKLPLPGPFMRVIWFQASHTAGGNNIYFAGETSHEGWWFLMLFSFLVKTPIPLLILLAVTVWRMLRSGRSLAGEWLLLILSVFLLLLFTYMKNVAVGLRYVLPIYPCFHVLAARALRDGVKLGRWARAGLVLLLAWYAFGAARIYPDHLAHFNELIGGPRNAHRYLADSHLDWGQDLKQLKAYLDRNDIGRIRLAYFGSADAEYYGIDYDYLPSVGLRPLEPDQRWWYDVGSVDDLPPFEPRGGPIAISATLLAGVFHPGYYAVLRELEPVAQVGHSILIYEPASAGGGIDAKSGDRRRDESRVR